MDELMIYDYLKSKGMGNMSEQEFMNKFRTFMDKYRGKTMRHSSGRDFAPMDRDSDFYMRRHEKPGGFMDRFDSGRNERFSDRYDADINEDDMYNAMRYMRHSMSGDEHFSESEAKYLVADMYHTEGGRRHSGEKFDIHKAKEICERYRGILPNSITPADVYVAINSQYHDYAELFKSWFGGDIEQKIIESAIVFWFRDADAKHENKLLEYFKEY